MADTVEQAQQIQTKDMTDLREVQGIVTNEILSTNLSDSPESLDDYKFKRREIVRKLTAARRLLTSIIGD